MIEQRLRISRIIIISTMGIRVGGISVEVMFFLLFFGVGGDFEIAIEIAQGKVNGFRISRIIVRSIGRIISIIARIIGGISVGGIRVRVHVFWCWGKCCNIDCNLSINMGDRILWS